jgi:hypothetical protein
MKDEVRVKRAALNRDGNPFNFSPISMNLRMPGLRINHLRILWFMAPMRVQSWRSKLPINLAFVAADVSPLHLSLARTQSRLTSAATVRFMAAGVRFLRNESSRLDPLNRSAAILAAWRLRQRGGADLPARKAGGTPARRFMGGKKRQVASEFLTRMVAPKHMIIR